MPYAFSILGLVGSLLGMVFSAFSTYDFVAHLDRQVHGLHCSFLPGVAAADASGTSGCHLTMMSPYSSVLRASLWGGIPIALPALSVFAFLLAWGLLVVLTRREDDPRATGFWAAAAGLPVLASLAMAIVSYTEIGAFCKLCIGIYVASGLTFLGALITYLKARGGAPPAKKGALRAGLSRGALAMAFAIGCLFVGSSTLAYALSAPDFTRYAGACGKLEKPDDPQKTLITLQRAGGSPALLEVIDPLCPACRAFEQRLTRLPSSHTAERKLLLFPLDNSCNWMVDRALHPGACAISEALLCAGDAAGSVLAWAFENQEALIAAERAKKGSAEKRALAQFPALAGCIGSSKVRARLNRSLRFAVDNHLPVLTPQLYVDGTRLCDADTDLGLDYMLTRLTDRRAR